MSLENGETFQLTGNTRPSVALAQDQGEVGGDVALPQVTMHFSMTSAQQTDLQQLLQQQVTRGSSAYHQWLTPEQYAERFGLNSNDVQKITAWLERQGFTNVQVSRGRTFVTFAGSAAQVRAAFKTSIHSYLSNGETHYANSSDPLLPKALEGVVSGLRGLNDMHPKPHAVRPVAHFTSSLTGNHFLTPDDFATIYDLKPLYGSGVTGLGQSIAIPGQSDISLTDIANFRTAAGLSANAPTVVLSGSDPGVSSSDQEESELDVEWAGGIAQNATIIFVNSTDVFGSMTYAIDNNLAPVLSVTYGNCEAGLGSAEVNSLNAVFQQGNAQGITIVAASGDNGAADCESGTSAIAVQGPAVDFPASSPYVTGVGGTTLNEGSGSYWSATNDANSGSAVSYIPEVAWNDTSSANGLAASGGGASIYFTKPSWQTGAGVPADGARDVPDVAFAASPNHDGYLDCSSSTYCLSGGFRAADTTLDEVGGTSASTPSFAGIVALLNQKYNSIQGNINPSLYTVSSVSSNAFHDITSGNNIVSCRSGSTGCTSSLQFGFSAGAGYDQVTGLGSVDANNLLSQWTAEFGATVNPTSMTVTHGTSASATVTITPHNGFAGIVSFSCSVASILGNTTCSIPGTVTGSGTATLTINATAVAALPPWRLHPSLPDVFDPLPAMTALSALIIGGMAFLLVGNLPLTTGRKKPSLALAGAVSVALVMIVSCGGGSSNTTSTVSSTAATLSLSASPTAVSLFPGQSGTSTVTVQTGGSFTGITTLAVSAPPSGVTATLSSTSVTGSSPVTLTLASTSSAAQGSYPLTISGSGSGLTATTTVTLNVTSTGLVTVTATSGTIISKATVSVTLN